MIKCLKEQELPRGLNGPDRDYAAVAGRQFRAKFGKKRPSPSNKTMLKHHTALLIEAGSVEMSTRNHVALRERKRLRKLIEKDGGHVEVRK